MDDRQECRHTTRRMLFRTGGGLLSGATALLVLPRAGKAGELPPISDEISPVDAQDPPAPPNMKRGAQVDARFPVSYRRSVPEGCRVLVAHFDSIATRNYEALTKTMQFPFAIIERIDTIVVKSASDLTNEKAPPSLNFSPNGQFNTDHYSRLEPGCYDILQSLEVVSFDALNVNMAMTFDRFNHYGIRTLRCEGIYCVTNNEGHWGIQLMSTIWTPADLIGMVYEDAKQAAIRLRANHLISYVDDDDEIDHPRPSRGLQAGISEGGIATLFKGQLANNPMSQFKVEGVKSRLVIKGSPAPVPGYLNSPDATITQPTERRNAASPNSQNNGTRSPHVPKWKQISDPYDKLGWNFYEGAIPADTRILHHTADKVHRYSGAARYTTSGEQISVSTELAVIVFGTEGDWTQMATFRYVTTHDRTNDDVL